MIKYTVQIWLKSGYKVIESQGKSFEDWIIILWIYIKRFCQKWREWKIF